MARWGKVGAIGASIGLLLGVLAVQALPDLPPWWCAALLGVFALLLGWRLPNWRWLAFLLFGIAWAAWHGEAGMAARLPRALEGRDFEVTGWVDSLPMVRGKAASFELRIDSAKLDGQALPLHGRLRLSRYDGAAPEPCTRWLWTLRLKRPRGLLDPGGADSERGALERGIVGVGYVREEGANRQLGRAPCIDGLRALISRGIAARVGGSHDAALLQAFAVGDTRGLGQGDWDIARANGISHLIAISGFHVGIAAVFGVWLAWGLYALWPGLGLRWPRQLTQAVAALLVAGAYTALAGFGLPTMRTLLMIAVVALARCSRRAGDGAQSLALALIAILLADPLAVLAPGFWLSFVGVGFLMLCLRTQGRGWRAFLHELTAGQLVMTVALLPLTLWFFGQASLVGALSNLIAVPFVSFVIVPCALAGALLLLICPPLATFALWPAAHFAHAQWWLLEHMATWPGAHWYLPEVRPLALLLATLGAAWLFMPRGLPLRWLGMLLFLPLLLPPRSVLPDAAFQAWVLDVGQGLAVLVRTRDHALVYDAGARYPSEFDLGAAVVVPSMHALGIEHLDVLMISHGDNDHAGGAPAVAAAFPEARRYAGEPGRLPISAQACQAGQGWQWNGVRFRVLWPATPGGAGNARSCVLLVEGGGGRLLLTGDIGAEVEPQVAAAMQRKQATASRFPLPFASDPALVLVVPHHGSRSSSSALFIQALQPALAVVSAGWRSRFGHPHPQIVQRYAQAGVPLLNTASSGAIQLDFPAAAAAPATRVWRRPHSRYWRE